MLDLKNAFQTQVLLVSFIYCVIPFSFSKRIDSIMNGGKKYASKNVQKLYAHGG